MSRSGRLKEEKSGKGSGFSKDDSFEGTSARTRPLSFDDIMLRRKNKKLSEDVKVGSVDVSTISRENVVENGTNGSESGRRKHKHNGGTQKPVEEEARKVSARKKGDNTLMKEDKTIKGKDREDNTARRKYREGNIVERKDREDNTYKGKDRENRESQAKLKDMRKRDSASKAKNSTDGQIHGRRRNDEHLSNDPEKEAEKKHSRDYAVKDNYSDRNRGNSERESSKRRHRNEDDETNRDRNDAVKDNYSDRNRGNSERESSKRRHRNEDDETNRDRNVAKKHDSGRRHDYEISERKERKESLKSHYEESRLKRGRSRSREHEKDRNRRSTSASPRVHKHTHFHRREHGEATSHTLKESSGRQHSDVDRGRISSNGSSSHYRRHGGSTSGLGGYSPRKRRTEAAIKTPSPIHRSPEKKNVGWDFPPAGTTSKLIDSVLPNLSSSNQTVSSNVLESVTADPVASSTVKPLAGISSNSLSTKKSSSNSIQLTQATRPMRSLYVENIPASTTEKAVMECLNNFLLSLDVDHTQGTHPCISCIILKDKGQALVEFLTPEDASAALSFDGRSFSGSILKIRRPKDFVDVATGDPDKSVVAVDTISDAVLDSPHKIFVGGISEALSSKMVMEIVSAFGPLKAYHFEVNNGQPCAFLEYVDHSVTLKACAGLSGMKLGGQVLTAVQAVPHDSSLETTHKPPMYGIPAHAKPLLKQPTQVLKLKNVFNIDALSSLTESEVEEVLEDIRLECARFGTVKSVNIIKQSTSPITSPEACTFTEKAGSTGTFHSSGGDKNSNTEISEGVLDHESPRNNKEINEAVKGEDDDTSENDLEEAKSSDLGQVDTHMATEDLACESLSKRNSPAQQSQISPAKNQMDCPDDKVTNIIQRDFGLENKPMAKGGEEIKDPVAGSNGSMDIAAGGIKKGGDEESDPHCVLERGCVLVEYTRTEAAYAAAHCLHGRAYGDQIVSVEYVAVDLYEAKFPK